MGSSNETSYYGPDVKNPWDADTLAGRFVRRFGGRGCGGSGPDGDRHGHRRLGAPARGAVRHHRLQAVLRAGVALRHDRVCLQPRPGGCAGADGRRCGAGHAGRWPVSTSAIPPAPPKRRCRTTWPRSGIRSKGKRSACRPSFSTTAGCRLRRDAAQRTRRLPRPRCGGRRGASAEPRSGRADVLRRRAGGGVEQPVALRRDPFRLPHSRGCRRHRVACTSARAPKASARR